MSVPAKAWTLEELHRLPDDGNKYEVIRGELFVTPAPSPGHEEVLARLNELLTPFVAKNGLGRVYHPRAVVRFEGSEAEPDLMVRAAMGTRSGKDWESFAPPLLVVEVLSATTRRRDLGAKREYYLDAGVREYWIVDIDKRDVRVIRREEADRVVRDTLGWQPGGAEELTIDVRALFD